MRPHRNLDAWNEALGLVTEVYRVTDHFPRSERHVLVDQMRRAAVSIPSNIAEGAARGSSRDFKRFVQIARGSVSELDTQLEISRRLGYLETQTESELIQRMDHIERLLRGLVRHLETT